MGPVSFFEEAVSLIYAEFVLFVNNNQAQSFNLEGVFNQGMGADDDSSGLGSLWGGLFWSSGEEWSFFFFLFDVTGPEANGNAKWGEPLLEGVEVLEGEDFCGGHENDVVVSFNEHEGNAGSDDGFAGADVPL